MNSEKKHLLGIIIVLVFAVVVILGTHYYVTSTGMDSPFTRLIFEHHFEFMLLIGLGGIAVGALSYYLMGKEVDSQKEIIKKNTRVLLNLLDFDEKKIIEKLLEEKGKAKQYELAYSTKLTKVKAHRAIKKLVSKNVVEIQKIGKVNSVKLNQEILEGLQD
ncbi:hypothetical protein HUU53_03295 [Candidatus Micrarchaeota archaeon]|nr:hypothetical protein [Candidatus Micrarchaeota archaeon]